MSLAAMSHRAEVRWIAIAGAVLMAIVLGTKIEKLLWINRHIDVCTDDTSPAFRRDLAEGTFCYEALDVFD